MGTGDRSDRGYLEFSVRQVRSEIAAVQATLMESPVNVIPVTSVLGSHGRPVLTILCPEYGDHEPYARIVHTAERTYQMNFAARIYLRYALFKHFRSVLRTARRGYPGYENLAAIGLQNFFDASPMRDFHRSY